MSRACLPGDVGADEEAAYWLGEWLVGCLLFGVGHGVRGWGRVMGCDGVGVWFFVFKVSMCREVGDICGLLFCDST